MQTAVTAILLCNSTQEQSIVGAIMLKLRSVELLAQTK